MTAPKTKSPKDVLNSSGHLLQAKAEDAVAKSSVAHGWEVLAREFPWKSSGSDREEYLDLLIGRTNIRLVVECKRPQTSASPWVFLPPPGQATRTTEGRFHWSFSTSAGYRAWAWDDVPFSPSVPQAAYGVIDPARNQQRILEQPAGGLVRACEALAAHESPVTDGEGTPRIYIPTVVTTASLYFCPVDLETVNLGSPTIADAPLEPVDAVLLRKAIAVPDPHQDATGSIQEDALTSERSVLVVTSSALIDFLERFEVKEEQHRSPWEDCLQRWPYETLLKALEGELTSSRLLKLEMTHGTGLSAMETLHLREAGDWLANKFSGIQPQIRACENYVNVALREVLYWPDESQPDPRDPEAIQTVAKKLGDIYRAAIDWRTEFHQVRPPAALERLFSSAASANETILKAIERIPVVLGRMLDQLASMDSDDRRNAVLRETIEVHFEGAEAIQTALDELNQG